MGQYLTKIQSLVREVETSNPKQITADVFQNFENDFITYREEDNEITKEEIANVQYRIDILLEVMDKKFVIDINLLKRLNKVLQDWYDALDNYQNT